MLSIIWIVLVTVPVSSDAVNDEAILIGKLLDNYNQPTARPVLNYSDVIVVTYRYFLTRVVELDERRQFLTVKGRMFMTWQDQLMVWNASEYGGIDTIKVPQYSIWMPDITHYNNMDVGFERTKTNIPLSITSDGFVTMATPAIYTTFCKMNVKYFPFDKQVCNFKLGSWTYGRHQVDLKILDGAEANQDYFFENGVWGLDFVYFKKNVVHYPWCRHQHVHITMTIGLNRHSVFYVGNILAPSILLSFLAAFVFFLPPECGEKISFSITNLLAIVLFQQLIAETLPPSDETPYLANFITLIISLGCISVVATSVILKLHFGRHSKPLNGSIHKIFVRGLGSALGVCNEPDVDRQPTYLEHLSISADIGNDTESTSTLQASSEFKQIMADIKKLSQQIDERKEEELTKTWTDLACVFDRLMLIFFMLFFFIASTVIIIMLLKN
ncbi:neuronal acetylcholine receptor subunit alpha-9-like [Anneissia japonica]|uniref:neuronal acetylcholine receptor subunit alpha-9-like n=1 Tax=Anneissia japonica TaxID=1529436 RepID=UPI001425AAE4|nr:neuronal acetylcholine receptor subunit alpha-9-like [Anneissia japonica]